jgi:hypothetical protein
MTAVVEYEVMIVHGGNSFTMSLPASEGPQKAISLFTAMRSTRRHGGILNLVAWSGMDRSRAVGLILEQHSWSNQ